MSGKGGERGGLILSGLSLTKLYPPWTGRQTSSKLGKGTVPWKTKRIEVIAGPRNGKN